MGNTIACQFVFEPGEYDNEFHLLDGQIDVFASELPVARFSENWTFDMELPKTYFKDIEIPPNGPLGD